MGTVRVDLGEAVRARDPLLGRLPKIASVQATHVESVLCVPEAATRLGFNAADDNHALRYGPRAWGVQFHPEFDADVMRVYLEQRSDVLRSEGFDPARMARTIRDSSEGSALLRRFGEIVRG
jgi:GMP synthase (glutamine-hydrolysing)